MPTRNVNLTDELDRFLLAKVESGRYENASEVVRAALRTFVERAGRRKTCRKRSIVSDMWVTTCHHRVRDTSSRGIDSAHPTAQL